MNEGTNRRLQAAAVAIGPLFLLAALFYHPFIANLTDKAAVAGAMTADDTRWAAAHIAVGVGFGLLLIALLAVCSYLRESGEKRLSSAAVPFLVMGTTLTTFLPAMETAMVAAARAGADAVAVQTELGSWFVPLMLSGALLFGIGVICMAFSVVESRTFSRSLTAVVSGGLVVMALSRFAPLGAALVLSAIAGVVALLPVAMRIRSSEATATLGKRSMLASSGGGVR